LIIRWKKLTGDEWNAFILFAWQVRHAIESADGAWKKDQIEPAMNEFVNSFYNGDTDAMRKLKKDSNYVKLVEIFNAN
jgi:hypothetical protein